MITAFTKLHDAIVKASKATGSTSKYTVYKKSLLDDLKMTSSRCENLVGTFNALSNADKQNIANKIYIRKNDPKSKACGIYATIANQCRTVADTKIAFSSITDGLKATENVINNFIANIDIIFEGGDDVNIHTAKMSMLAAFGFIEKTEMYLSFILALFTTITYEIVENDGTRELAVPQPYRYKFLADKLDDFVQFHSSIINGGNRVYLETFKSLKGSLDDVKVANPETGSNIEMIDNAKLSSLSRGLFGSFSLNPFKWLGELATVHRHNKYVEMAAEKEDLLAHVSLLQMDLAEMDPNSAEYQKMIKVIDNYNKIIADMDRKIEAYYIEY